MYEKMFDEYKKHVGYIFTLYKMFHMGHMKGGETMEEINHPARYKAGKFECIDIMIDVFGANAVKNFCILNAFKYIWRSEKKNGIEDIKKAVWYLNKYIEISCNK